jgi:hypothetical protein
VVLVLGLQRLEAHEHLVQSTLLLPPTILEESLPRPDNHPICPGMDVWRLVNIWSSRHCCFLQPFWRNLFLNHTTTQFCHRMDVWRLINIWCSRHSGFLQPFWRNLFLNRTTTQFCHRVDALRQLF